MIKKIGIALGLLLGFSTYAADVKISDLPLGSAASTNINDSFPYVDSVAGVTKRLKLSDLINVPTITTTYAPIASPTFTGVVTAPSFVGAVTGTTSGNTTYTANNHGVVLSSSTNAMNVLAPSSSTVFSLISGGASANPTWSLLTVPGGGTGLATITLNGMVFGNGASALGVTAAGSQYQIFQSGASGVPTVGAIHLDQSAAVTGVLPNANTTGTASAGNSTLVARDGSGNFAAGVITASLTGNASTATALFANPTDCGANTYATTIDASGNLTCASITNASTTASSSAGSNTLVVRDGSGNFAAGTITAALTGNASTATALAANPTDCGSNTYATAIDAGGNLTCASVTNASTTATASAGNSTIVARDGSGNFAAGTITAALTGNASTATALAANPTDCGANTYATTIDAGGNLTCASITNASTTATNSATASTILSRDANANSRINSLISNFATTATAAGTTTLTVSSSPLQQFTGSTTQTVVLPDATTLVAGQEFTVFNRSSGIVTVNANGGGLVQTMSAATQSTFTAVTVGTSAGTWDSAYSSASGGTGTVTSVALTVPTGFAVSGSPVTTTGTLGVTLSNASANTIWAGPTSGSAAPPTLRAVVPQDLAIAPVAKSISYAWGAADYSVNWTTGSSALTGTLPTAVGISGRRYTGAKVDTGSGAVSIATTSSQTISGISSNTIKLATVGDTFTVESDGANWQLISIRSAVAFRGTASSQTPLTLGATTPYVFTANRDTYSEFNGVDTFTVPITGYYWVAFSGDLGAASSTGTNAVYNTNIYKNGSLLFSQSNRNIVAVVTLSDWQGIAQGVELFTAGDTITANMTTNFTTPGTTSSGVLSIYQVK